MSQMYRLIQAMPGVALRYDTLLLPGLASRACALSAAEPLNFHAAGSLGVVAGAGAVALLSASVADAEEPSTSSSRGADGSSWWKRQGAAAGPERQQAGPGPSPQPPLSGAPAALDELNLTNHPLDYNPITNEHTAAMTLAKQAAMEYYNSGKYKEAEKRFLEALEEARLGFPPDDLHIPSSLNALAEFYRNTKQYSKAEELYQQAVDQLMEVAGEKHWMVASALCNLGLMMEEQGRYKEAQAVLQRALNVRRQLFSDKTYPYADMAALLARVMVEAGGQEAQAIALYSKAIKIVEEAGNAEDTPAMQWLLGMADAQLAVNKPKDAVTTLKKAYDMMLTKKEDTTTSSSSSGIGSEADLSGELSGNASGPAASSSSGSPGSLAVSIDGARAQLVVEASEVNEKLVDALVAAGQMQEARQRMLACVEARMHMFGGHLLVAKTMSRLAQLLLQPPLDPGATQQALHFASGAITIAKTAYVKAKKPSLFSWLLVSGIAPEKATAKLQSLLQLCKAYQVLAEAHEAEGKPAAAAEVLRKGVELLRQGQKEGGEDVQHVAKKLPDESPVIDKLAGLLLDMKLLQLDLLEALATALREHLQQGQQQQRQPSSSPASRGPVRQASSQSERQGQVQQGVQTSAEEIRMLLVEAETIAGELYGVS